MCSGKDTILPLGTTLPSRTRKTQQSWVIFARLLAPVTAPELCGVQLRAQARACRVGERDCVRLEAH